MMAFHPVPTLFQHFSTDRQRAGGGRESVIISRNGGCSSGTDGLNIGGGITSRKSGRYIHVGLKPSFAKPSVPDDEGLCFINGG